MEQELPPLCPGLRRILLPKIMFCMIALLLLVGIGGFAQYIRNYERQIRSNHEAVILLYKQSVKDYQTTLGVITRLVGDDATLPEMLEKRDGAGLFLRYGASLARLGERYGLTCLAFADARGRIIRHVHKPDQNGDPAARPLYTEAMTAKDAVSGLDAGPGGELTLRMVRPVYRGGELAGFIEAALDIRPVVEVGSNRHKMDMAFVLSSDRLTPSRVKAAGRGAEEAGRWVRADADTRVYTTVEGFDAAFAGELRDYAKRNKEFQAEGRGDRFAIFRNKRYYTATAVSLSDSEGFPLGDLFVLEDVTYLLGEYALGAAILLGIGILVVLFGRGMIAAGLDRADEGMAAMVGRTRRYVEFLQRIIDQLPGLVSIKDSELRLVLYNAAFARVFASPDGGSMVGQIRHTGWLGREMDVILKDDAEALRSGKPLTAEQDLTFPDGATCTFLTSRRVSSGMEGGVYLLTMATDITEGKRTERELVALSEKAEAASVAKSEFLARMSHELRTPINVILGMTQLALAARPGEALANQLAKIKDAANRLLKLISDILEYANAEQGKIRPDAVVFSLEALLREIAGYAAARFTDPAVRFESAIPSLRQLCLGDPALIGKVLYGLLENARKFTLKGRVRLECEPREEDQESYTLYFAVADTGIGIAEERTDVLFQGFQQLDGGHNRRYGGVGLGLAMIRHYIHLMGGDIGLRSMEGEGSTFFFTLRLPKAAQREDGPETTPGPGTFAAAPAAFPPFPPLPAPGPGGLRADAVPAGKDAGGAAGSARDREQTGARRVLVVDDNPVNQEIMVELLHGFGLEARTAGNGQEAVEAVREGVYGLVLMDIQMPVMDGLAATRAIRALPDARLRGLPIIALTANALQKDQDDCNAAGMDDFISKPVDVAALRQKLDHWLGGTENEARAAV